VSLTPIDLSQAIVVWTGWRDTSWPSRDEARLVGEFGPEGAADLIPRIRQLEDEFYASDARFVVSDLKEMGDAAAHRFQSMHPELSEEAIRALAWCYTYDFK
jgi:hypothetical protein